MGRGGAGNGGCARGRVDSVGGSRHRRRRRRRRCRCGIRHPRFRRKACCSCLFDSARGKQGSSRRQRGPAPVDFFGSRRREKEGGRKREGEREGESIGFPRWRPLEKTSRRANDASSSPEPCSLVPPPYRSNSRAPSGGCSQNSSNEGGARREAEHREAGRERCRGNRRRRRSRNGSGRGRRASSSS